MAQELTIKQLRGFATLAETGSFKRAAARLGVTQPALSYHIARLEEQLGTQLFERVATGVILTPEGRKSLDLAMTVLDGLGALGSLSARREGGMPDDIRLGVSPTLGPYLMPRVTRRLYDRYPTLRIFVQEAPPTDLLEGLLSGRHDAVIAQLPLRSDRIRVERLFREPLLLVMGKDHPLAEKTTVEDADLAGAHVLSLSTAFTMNAQLVSLCDELGAVLRADYEGTSLDALRNMTAINMGVTFLPALYLQSSVGEAWDDVVLRRFRGDRLTRSIGLAWRESSSGNVIYAELSKIIRMVVADEFSSIVVPEPAA